MYEYHQIINTGHLQFGEMTKNCEYRPGGLWKLIVQLNKLIWVLLQIAENTSTNPDDGFVIQIESSMHFEMHSHRISGEKRNKSYDHKPQKKTQQVRGGGKTKMLHIQMKVLEPKWNQEQRRSLQNKVNKYTNRSSRTFICCLSLEVKSRFPN